MKLFATTFAATMALTGLSATVAKAEPFTLLIFESHQEMAKRTDTGDAGTAYWNNYADFAAQARKAGILKGGAALYADDKVLSVTSSNGKTATGPAFDADQDLRLGGFFQIDVAGRDAAVEWAAKIPASATGRIEIRSDYPAPSMN